MNKILRDNLLRFAILVPVQILILNYVHLFGFLNPYVYLMALLLLPFNMPKSLQYLIAFVTGLIIDIFSMSYGIHASASTLIIFLRPFFLRMLDGNRATELGNAPLPGLKSFSWIATYTAVLVFIHHFTVTMLEVFTFIISGVISVQPSPTRYLRRSVSFVWNISFCPPRISEPINTFNIKLR